MIRRFGLTFAAGAFLASVFAPAPANAQLWTWTKDQMAEYTKAWTGDRFPDGRPKVPDALLQGAKGISSEEVQVNMGGRGGGQYGQFADGFVATHPKVKMTGRAVTLQFMPARSDLDGVVTQKAQAAGGAGLGIQYALDKLQPGDVVVIDLLGMKDNGALINNDLLYYILKATKGGGIVLNGGFKDSDAVSALEMPSYYRDVRAGAAVQLTLAGVNVPVRIGNVTVMPGDLLMGDAEGVSFIPPQMAQRIIDAADDTHVHDEWTRKKFDEGKYVSSDIYSTPRDQALRQEYQEYLKKRLEEIRAGRK
jgi:regulator of RNase E activity RraA